MPPKLQGMIVLGMGVVVLLAGSVGSIALLSGAATGSGFPHAITGFGLALTVVGWIGFAEVKGNFHAIPWAAGLLVVSLVALGIFGQP